MGMRENIVRALMGKAQAPLAGKPGGVWEGGIRAYHSSPHDFDKVDFSKLRTGEGANVYGAGHYMAENPAVSGQGGQYWKSFLDRFQGTELDAAETLSAHGFNREKAVNEMRKALERIKARAASPESAVHWKNDPAGQAAHFDRFISRLQSELDALTSGKPVGPRTYEMNLRAKPEELLDWDKPLNQQPQVFDVLRQSGIIGDKAPPLQKTGQATGRAVVQTPWQGARVEERMAEAGIPGIRYLDAGSKQHQQNILDAQRFSRMGPSEHGRQAWAEQAAELQKTPVTYNYVGTDPSKLDILAKYGVAGAVPIGMGASYAQDRYEVPR